MKIVSVDGQSYTPEAMDEAISHPKDGKITVVVRNFDSVQTREIQYAGIYALPAPGEHLGELMTIWRRPA